MLSNNKSQFYYGSLLKDNYHLWLKQITLVWRTSSHIYKYLHIYMIQFVLTNASFIDLYYSLLINFGLLYLHNRQSQM